MTTGRQAREPELPRRLAWALALGLGLAASRLPAQTTHTWPGAVPCNGTLQACIDAAAGGDIVEVATDGPIAEAIDILGKSLTLRPAAGFAPVFAPFPFIDAIEAFGGDSDVTVVIEGMTAQDSTITAYQRGTGRFDVTIRGNTIQAASLDADFRGIAVRSFGPAPYGPMGFLILENELDLGFALVNNMAGISIRELQGPGASAGTIAGNLIQAQGSGSTGAAIEIRNTTAPLSVGVIANHIRGAGFNEGISVFQTAEGGSTAASIVNNLVTGTVEITGPQPGGISLLVEDGTGSFTVLNNTVAENEVGVVVGGDLAAGGSLSGVLANNVVAGNTSQGIVIDSDFAAPFTNEDNLVFGNGANAFTAGPGTLVSDPLFVGGGDFHLQIGSPARDAGNASLLPAGIVTDLDGAPRVQGPEVDLGAYELAELPGTVQFASDAFAVRENAGPALITLTRTGGAAGELAVRFSTTYGTAMAGADYTAVDTLVVWNDGDGAPKTVAIPILDDLLLEGDESVVLTIAEAQPIQEQARATHEIAAPQVGGPSMAVLTILDDESTTEIPTLSQWGLALLAALVAAAALWRLRPA